ncbi:ubiquitin thioesterase OTUB2-like isoform X2 [Boleophthalmus pectinirostris]|uniref:ubiquitin thioesterase OTUB2-like isoform X2 n=1 Tax=Boleophthalmus pectinirostris TaxID=150288 RepID=UPI000A1C5E32|nr:ubiquitin thioesterase OTUB2-like isoform X2 [Boleophthalmus pectinirostris]
MSVGPPAESPVRHRLYRRPVCVLQMEGGWLVSEREDIASYFADQTPNSKITVCQEFSTVRKVRGDGNCFYRAFSFAFLESAIQNSRGLQGLIEIMQSPNDLSCAGFDERCYKDHLSKVMNVLEQCQSDGRVETLYRLFNQPSTSDSMVQYLRLITSAHLQIHADFFSNFVVAPNLQAYCHQEVEVMAMECDHVDIQALSQALNVSIHIVSMEGDEQKLVHHIIPEGAEPSVHLLYQTSHYNIIYPRT